jgi:hypothetical protein
VHAVGPTPAEHVGVGPAQLEGLAPGLRIPHGFNADPDPDPAFFLNCGSGFRIRIPDPGFDDLKLEKIYSWKFNFYFLDQKL